MEVLTPEPEHIDRAVEVLRNGGVVAHATETCYGLACDISNPDAVMKLFACKKRPDYMPVSALFASIDQAKEYLEWNELAEELAAKHLPGPLTIILSQKTNILFPIPYFPSSQNPISQFPKTQFPSIGLRLSPHPTAQALVEAFGAPISTTSANLHGESNPYSPNDILDQYANQNVQPDIILDDGIIANQDASTVVDCSKEKVVVLRQGGIRITE